MTKLRLLAPIITAIVIVVLSGCSASSRLKRAEKLIARAEEQGAKWHTDTVTVLMPVRMPETRVDSIFTTKPGDTVVLTKDRLTVKYVRLRGDTVFIDAECAADTIYQKVPVTIVKQIKAPQKIKWWWLLIAFVAGVTFWVAYNQVKDYRK